MVKNHSPKLPNFTILLKTLNNANMVSLSLMLQNTENHLGNFFLYKKEKVISLR